MENKILTDIVYIVFRIWVGKRKGKGKQKIENNKKMFFFFLNVQKEGKDTNKL